MVLLTMTPSIVEAIIKSTEAEPPTETQSLEVNTEVQVEVQVKPSLNEPAIGNPISHGQIVHLWKQLKAHDAGSFSLESLLRGAKVYTPPPPPKPEPVRFCPVP